MTSSPSVPRHALGQYVLRNTRLDPVMGFVRTVDSRDWVAPGQRDLALREVERRREEWCGRHVGEQHGCLISYRSGGIDATGADQG